MAKAKNITLKKLKHIGKGFTSKQLYSFFKEGQKNKGQEKEKLGSYQLQPHLSSEHVKVYHDPRGNSGNGHAVVVHSGTRNTNARGQKTLKDWLNNAVGFIGGNRAYKMTPRFQESLKQQRAAEEAFGAENTSVIGHSQGGIAAKLASEHGRNHEVVTYNPASFENSPDTKNAHNYRTAYDPVSVPLLFNPRANTKTIKMKKGKNTLNPIDAHSFHTLNDVDENEIFGEAGVGASTSNWDEDDIANNKLINGEGIIYHHHHHHYLLN
jgi:hypothetical protein